MLHWLAQPLEDPLTRRALLEVGLLAVGSGVLGCWIVLYRLSYSAESLAHSLFPGLVAATLLGVPLLLGGAMGAVIAAAAIALAARVPAIDSDTGVAVVITALFGGGVLLALSPDSPPRIQELLFGDVLGVTDSDLVLAGVLTAVLAGALALFHPRLLAVGFDPAGAPRLGVPTGAVRLGLLVALAVAVLIAVQALGNLLVVALLVAPAAAAREITNGIGAMMGASVILGVLSGVGGLWVSFHAETAAGASIALACVGAWLLCRTWARAFARYAAV